MLQPWQKATVIKIEQITHNTRSFFLQLDEVASFDFKPGQFVTLDLPIHEKPHKRLRSYSIASWPNGTNVIELCIVLLDDGAGTTYLFNHVNVGDHITLRGPVGVFTLEEAALQNDLFLICTGTGIAPFRSMVHWLYTQQQTIKNIYLIFGCRTQGDLLYHTELQQLSNQMQGFHYLPTLSRVQWEGATGYVHQVYENIITQQPTPHANFMLCGWKAMIDEAKQRIIELGYDRKAIHTELYG